MSVSDRLRAHDVDQCLAAIREIAQHQHADAAEVEGLLECLESDHKIVCRRAAETFALLGPRDVMVQAALTQALRSSAARRRWGAAYALGLLGPLPPDAVSVLIEALGVDDGDLRWAAADILVQRVPQVEVIPALSRLLRTGTAVQRKMAAYCLRDLEARSPECDAALLHCLRDPDTALRLAAIAALARVASDRSAVAGTMAQMLGDVDAGVRRAAAVAVGALGERSDAVLSALRAALSDPDPSLRRAARRSLGMLTG